MNAKRTIGGRVYFYSCGISLETLLEEVEQAKKLYENCTNFCISTEDNCGDLELNYERLETDEEYKRRLKVEQKTRRVQEERRKKKEEKELALLKKLKEKYEAD